MKNSLVVLRKCLIALALTCPAGVGVADSPWFLQTVESQNGHYMVTLQSSASEFALNEFREWHIVVKDKATGEGVSPARFMVSGGMPMHGHGLPSQPQVSKHLGDGRYLIEGVRFNMLGQWLFSFEVVTQSVTDSVSFEVIVDY